MFSKFLFFILFSISLFSIGQTQEKESIKFFVDCNCDKDYIRQEIKSIDHVRDQGLANVKLFIYDIGNGSGGKKYRLEFTGTSSFKDITETMIFDSNANMTSDDIRKQLVRRIKKALLKYIMKSDIANRVVYRVKVERKAEAKEDEELNLDPWHNWIFEVYGEGKYNKEASRKRFEYKIGFESDHVTDNWRVRTDFQVSQNKSKFIRNDEEFTSERNRYFVRGSVVRSLSDHWSTGIFLNLRHDTFTNIELQGGFSPAIEYNIFPYSEVLKREIVFAYKLGYLHNDYIETTIFSEDHEVIFNHSFDIQVRYRQPWGNVYSRIIASAFLEDFSKNRLEMNNTLSLRVFKGFSVRFSGDLQFIQDQINLPAGDASLEDVLLQQKQIATDFDLELSVGVTYVFGSAFNNIINTRL